jgi:hypothetical protein
MATDISTSSGLITNSAGHSRALESMRLRHLSLGDSPLEALSLSRACLEVLERGDSLSWYFGAPFRVNIIQKAVSALFENPHPQLCGTAAGPGHGLEWDDIVREFDPRRFEYHGGAVYRGHLRGQLVQLSENDWNMMHSGVPQMLLSHWPPMRHIHAELETLAYSITELRKWNREALEGAYDCPSKPSSTADLEEQPLDRTSCCSIHWQDASDGFTIIPNRVLALPRYDRPRLMRNRTLHHLLRTNRLRFRPIWMLRSAPVRLASKPLRHMYDNPSPHNTWYIMSMSHRQYDAIGSNGSAVMT